MISKRVVAFIKLDDLLDSSPLCLESFLFSPLRLLQFYILPVAPSWFQ